MRRTILLVTVALLMVAFASVAQAQPADKSPVNPTTGHTHHVHTGNGECVDINSVKFEADTRGLHQGSNASGFHTQGPFHGPCHGTI